MLVKKLDADTVKKLYEEKMKRDFPPNELRPYSSIKSLTKQGNYLFFGLEDGGMSLAYASFATDREQGVTLLDYFAVDESLRGKGIGRSFISELTTRHHDLTSDFVLIEVESTQSAQTEQQAEERERRIRFYEHCGAKRTGVFAYLFGVEYQIMVLPLNAAVPSDETVKSSLESIYEIIVRPLAKLPSAFRKVCRCFYGSEHSKKQTRKDV